MELLKQEIVTEFITSQKIKFGKKVIAQLLSRTLSPPLKQAELTDSVCNHLKLMIYRSGRAVFYARFRWKYRHYSLRLGEYGEISIEDAREDAVAFKLSVTRGNAFVPTRFKSITFLDAFEEYLAHSKALKKSYRHDRSKFDQHISVFFSEHLKLKDVRESDIQMYLKYLCKEGLAVATRDRHIALLKAAVKFFLSKDWICQSFVENIKTVNPKNGRVRYLTKSELKRFIQSCRSFDGDSYRLFEFLAATGMRISEGASVTLDNWDRSSNTLYLPDSKTGDRHVVLNPTAVSILTLQSDIYGQSGLAFRGKSSHKPMSRPSKAWKRVTEHAGLADGTVSPHILRHSFCAQLLMANVSEFTVAKLMGLSSTKCIHRHYGHLCNGVLAEGSAEISAIIDH